VTTQAPPPFVELADRIRAGAVTHDDFADMLERANTRHRITAAPPRAELMDNLYRFYPTQAELCAYLRTMLDGYEEFMRAAGATPHTCGPGCGH
jgi:hypothetical protein